MAGGWIKVCNGEICDLNCLAETAGMSQLRSCNGWGMCSVREVQTCEFW